MDRVYSFYVYHLNSHEKEKRFYTTRNNARHDCLDRGGDFHADAYAKARIAIDAIRRGIQEAFNRFAYGEANCHSEANTVSASIPWQSPFYYWLRRRELDQRIVRVCTAGEHRGIRKRIGYCVFPNWFG